jgi:hypothetical protein
MPDGSLTENGFMQPLTTGRLKAMSGSFKMNH